jgi:hypothetical protein
MGQDVKEDKKSRLIKRRVHSLRRMFHQQYCFITIAIAHFSCYLPLTKPGLRYLYSCSYTDLGCPVIEVSSF